MNAPFGAFFVFRSLRFFIDGQPVIGLGAALWHASELLAKPAPGLVLGALQRIMRCAVPEQFHLVHGLCVRENKTDMVRDMKIGSKRVSTKSATLGFTLLELLVVVAIIGLLASYVGPKYFAQIGKSEQGVAKAQIEAFGKALDQFRLDMGRYPTTAEGINALMERPAGAAKWGGPYLAKAIPLDPWGKAYMYKAPGTKGKDYDITSFGSDAAPGGTDAAADVTN